MAQWTVAPVSEELTRLLGAFHNDDDQAQSIGMPLSPKRHGRAIMPQAPIRPINTLKQRNDKRPFTKGSSSNARVSYTYAPLDVQHSRGSNVQDLNRSAELVDGFGFNGSAKRRKMGHDSLPVSMQVRPPSSNDIHHASREVDGLHNDHRTSHLETRAGSGPSQSNIARMGDVSEYRTVNRTMDSRVPSRQQRRGPRSSSGRSSETQSSQTGSSLPDVLDAHRPTMRTGDGPHSPISPQRLVDSQIKQMPTTATSDLKVAHNICRVETASKCTKADDSSSDELNVGNTVGRHASPSQQSPSKSTAPCRTTSTTPIDSKVELEPSIIKPTKFGHSRRSTSKILGPSSFFLESINIPGPGYLNSEDLSLDYDEQKRSFVMKSSGGHLVHAGSLLQIPIKKMNKVSWASDCNLVRIWTVRDGNADAKIDIKLINNNNTKALTRKISESDSTVRIEEKESETLKKWFDVRLAHKESYEAQQASNDTLVPLSRRCSSNDAVNPTCSGSKLIDGLLARTKLEDNADQIAKLSAEHPGCAGGGLHSTQGERKQPVSRTGAMLRNLAPSHNEHLRRVTRSSMSADSEPISQAGADGADEIMVNVKADLGTPWKKPLTYPMEGKKKATVEFADLERLDETEFLNDSIVAFYIRFLEHRLEIDNPTLAKKMYFFSTFFYERLTSSTEDSKGINYEAVQKWTRGIDIFQYDYIVVPVNEAFHWYLAIICNLSALEHSPILVNGDSTSCSTSEALKTGSSPASRRQSQTGSLERGMKIDGITEEKAGDSATLSIDSLHIGDNGRPPDSEEDLKCIATQASDGPLLEQPEHTPTRVSKTKSGHRKQYERRKSEPPITRTDPNVPLIITLDSLGSPHGVLMKSLRSYLLAEGRHKKNGLEYEVSSIKGINAKNIPRQNNFHDCGLYMLGYLQKFLHDGPSTFISNIIRRAYEAEDWRSLVPSRMRHDLRTQLQSLHAEQDEAHRVAKAAKRNQSKYGAFIGSEDGISSSMPADGSDEVEPEQHDGFSKTIRLSEDSSLVKPLQTVENDQGMLPPKNRTHVETMSLNQVKADRLHLADSQPDDMLSTETKGIGIDEGGAITKDDQDGAQTMDTLSVNNPQRPSTIDDSQSSVIEVTKPESLRERDNVAPQLFFSAPSTAGIATNTTDPPNLDRKLRHARRSIQLAETKKIPREIVNLD